MKFKKCVTALTLLAGSIVVHADILAQSGYQAGQDGVLLMTEKCPADATGELRVAVQRSAGRTLEGCYVLNNRGNAVVKWSNGDIRELDWSMFGSKPLGATASPKGTGGYSAWEFFSNKTSKGTPVCGVFSASTDKTNARNVGVKSLANREVLSVTLFNDRWNYKATNKLPVSVDFGDNQALRVDGYAEGRVVDIEIPEQHTGSFITLMIDSKVIRFKAGQGALSSWEVPLGNMKAPMKQFVDCILSRSAQ